MTDPGLARLRAQALAGDPKVALETRPKGRPAGIEPADSWLAGVALAALGRYAEAIGRLTEESVAASRLAPRCQATVASVYRQVGMHGRARERDLWAVRRACAAGDRVAIVDARLGLAADAVGLGEVRAARAHVHGAARALPAGGGGSWTHDHWPRQRVRLEWVRCEVALLSGDVATAAARAESAVAACAGRSPRHLAKSLMFRGVAVAAPGDGLDDLRRAAELADAVGAAPLLWPTNLLLARHAPDPRERAQAHRSAADAYTYIGAHLASDMTPHWWRAPAARELGLDQRTDVP